MIPIRFLLFLFFLGLTFQLNAQCPGCVIDLPANMPEDTVYMASAPDGEVGQYYDGDISFRLPKTTTSVNVVDPTVPPGLPISTIDILSVSNLPPGLNWEASKLTFDVGDGDTDGCVKFCGTPTLPDSFFIQVTVTADVLGIVQSSTFFLSIYIAPAATTNLGFSMLNNVACGSTLVTFTNNVPSNGQDGFSYFWDFGNGNSTTMENPGPQAYNEPGVYPVTYQAIVDTSGYFLTAVTIEDTDCNDVLGIPPNNKPDLYIRINNPAGNTLFTSSIANNADLPYTFYLNLLLDEGNYSVIVFDDDLIGQENCGSVNFSKTTTGILYDGALEVSLNINHPVSTINTVDSVFVFETPDDPNILDMGFEYCEGETAQLEVTNYAAGLQWYKDSLPIVNATESVFEVDENGNYWVVYTSEEGCISISDPVYLTFSPPPALPVYINNDNLLSLSNPGVLPAEYSLQWYKDGDAIQDAIGQSYCIVDEGTFTYTLEVTNLATGCTNAYSQDQTYDPNEDCTTGVWDEAITGTIRLFPNPASEVLQIYTEDIPSGQFEISCFNLLGQNLMRRQITHLGGSLQQALAVSGLESGWHLLVIRSLDGTLVMRETFVKE